MAHDNHCSSGCYAILNMSVGTGCVHHGTGTSSDKGQSCDGQVLKQNPKACTRPFGGHGAQETNKFWGQHPALICNSQTWYPLMGTPSSARPLLGFGVSGVLPLSTTADLTPHSTTCTQSRLTSDNRTLPAADFHGQAVCDRTAVGVCEWNLDSITCRNPHPCPLARGRPRVSQRGRP